jgi:hypothetical protein
MLSTTSGGRLVKTTYLLSAEQIAAVDTLARAKHLTRSAVLRLLVDLGLKAQERLDLLAETTD